MKPDFSQLRDFHLPAPVSWWPPAPGWWALLVLALIAAALIYWIYTYRRRNRWREGALKELAQLRDAAPEQVLRELSVLLRRVAISRFPRRDVAAISGEAWLAFLDRSLDSGTAFQNGTGRVLLKGPYVGKADFDTAALIALCERWIKGLPSRGAA